MAGPKRPAKGRSVTEPIRTREEQRKIEADAEGRLQYVWLQVNAVENGEADGIKCPYCDSENPKGIDPLCCELLLKAIVAVLNRKEVVKASQDAHRILERALNN
jgi:hypothetical protein